MSDFNAIPQFIPSQFKASVSFPVDDEMLIDLGLLPAPPIDAETRRRWAREDRRRAIAYGIARPLQWLGRGSAWLHVEALNVLLWAFRIHSRVAHDRREDDDEW